jgi:hypothetical protein
MNLHYPVACCMVLNPSILTAVHRCNYVEMAMKIDTDESPFSARPISNYPFWTHVEGPPSRRVKTPIGRQPLFSRGACCVAMQRDRTLMQPATFAVLASI